MGALSCLCAMTWLAATTRTPTSRWLFYNHYVMTAERLQLCQGMMQQEAEM